jgi:multiple antibiotic resistance protein
MDESRLCSVKLIAAGDRRVGQIAASIVLLIIALDRLRVQRSRVQEPHEEKKAGAEKDEMAITPLAIPMLAGPGAISTTILLQNEARHVP